jgi:hypothetical protein
MPLAYLVALAFISISWRSPEVFGRLGILDSIDPKPGTDSTIVSYNAMKTLYEKVQRRKYPT